MASIRRQEVGGFSSARILSGAWRHFNQIKSVNIAEVLLVNTMNKRHNTQYFATVIISACRKTIKIDEKPCHFNEFAEKFYYVVYIYLLVWYRITKHLLLIFHFVTCSFFKLWIRSTSEEARDRKRRKTEERKKEHCSWLFIATLFIDMEIIYRQT